jgi:hypothetical protein
MIEQRLKNVVAPIDQDDLDIGVSQRVRCRDPAKPPPTITTRFRSGRGTSTTTGASSGRVSASIAFI